MHKLDVEVEFNQDQSAISEVVGKVLFKSSGLVRVHCQPYNCINLITAMFNVTDNSLAPDILIGKDCMTKVTKLRQKGLSYDDSPGTAVICLVIP